MKILNKKFKLYIQEILANSFMVMFMFSATYLFGSFPCGLSIPLYQRIIMVMVGMTIVGIIIKR